MVVLRIVLLFYALLSIFVAGGLFFQKKGKPYLLLSIFILLFGLEMLDFLYSTSALLKTFPDLYGYVNLLVGFLYGPILWFHFKALYNAEKEFSFWNILHFVPFIVVLILYSDILVLPGYEKVEFKRLHFYDRVMPLNYMRAAHLFLYASAFVWLLFKNADKLTIKNRLYAIAVCSLYILTAVLSSWLTLFADHWRQFIFYYLIAATIVLIVGVILYLSPDFLEGLARKYLRSSLDDETMNRIAMKIEKSFSNEKVFLQNELNLDKLANHIDEKPHYISQTLSEWVGENFNDFVNRHRIEHAKVLLSDINYDHYKIEAIALEAGFNNKVTFNKAFVKFTAMTPSVFKRSKK